MCSAFTLNPTRKQILESLDQIQLPEDFTFDRRILPQTESLVVTKNGGYHLKPMVFSMTPSWSKDPKVKFATHNARLETVLEKPTWRGPLKTHRCLVPISEFIEPIYSGELAGNMVRFSEKSHHLLFAAGIFDIWMNKETGEVKESFAIITSDPPEFIYKTGHDRCPLFLKSSAFDAWLDWEKTNSQKAIELLKENRQELEFDILKPKKATNNQRYYTKKDVENAFIIRKLLHRDRFSIEGARAAMRDLKSFVKKEKDWMGVNHKIENIQDQIGDLLLDVQRAKSLFS